MWDTIGELTLRGGPWGLIGFAVLSIFRGWLIPRTWHRERIADYQRALAAAEATVHERDIQIGILLGHAKEPVS